MSQLNTLLGLGTLVLQVASVALVLTFILKRDARVLTLLGRYGLHVIFLVSLAGVALSLLYSEVFGFVPCGLCWLQRVFLYPQVIIAGIGLYARDRHASLYAIGLSLPGIIVGLYQHYLQMGGSALVGCPTAGGDCAKRILFELDYITFPLMSVSVFVFITITALLHWRYRQQA